MRVRVATPDEFLGDVMGDLNTRRGQIEGVEPRASGHSYIVIALVPQPELLSYTADLRSMTEGRTSHEMEFSHYQTWGSDDDSDNGAGVPSPLKPIPPTLSAGAAAQPPPDNAASEHS